MSFNGAHASDCKLSICIPTYNRASILRATLGIVISQATDDCEIVISDNASTDETEQVIAEYSTKFGKLRYVKQPVNGGIDFNTDKVVEAARGEYCWLVPDDDPLKAGAIAMVLSALQHDYCLIVVNAEIVDAHTDEVIMQRSPAFESDRVYGPDDLDGLMRDAGDQLTYLGAVVIKRSIWLARERKRYYGSLLGFFAVIFQQKLPGSTLVMATPLICHKFGNQTWFGNVVEMMGKCSALLESLAVSEAEKKRRLAAQFAPTSGETLLLWRAVGSLSWTEYRRWIGPLLHSTKERIIPTLIVLLPRKLAYVLMRTHCLVTLRGVKRRFLLSVLGEGRQRNKRVAAN